MTSELLHRTAELIAVPSVSENEAELASIVEAELRSHHGLVVDRIGDNIVARTMRGERTRLILAGHLDTVPANSNSVPRIDNGVLWGLGSADMKGGIALMLAIAANHHLSSIDLTFVLYAREEIAFDRSGLLEIEREKPELLVGDVAILGEPTDGAVEAGCQGVLRGTLTLAGARAHSARAWMGHNAIHRANIVLSALDAWQPRRPVLEGCQFHEALLATRIDGGVAGNVVPDRCSIDIAHRFAPDRTAAEAEAWLAGWLAPYIQSGDTWDVTERAPAAYPGVAHHMLARLRDDFGLEVRAKLGWTDVAFFASRGVPAVNFGPGDPLVAHTANEHVTQDSLGRVFEVLNELVLTGPT